MIIEAIALVGITAVIMFLFAEKRKPVAGIFGSVMLLVLSYWIIASGVQVQSGETHIDANIGLEVGSANGTNDGSSSTNGSITAFSQDMKTNITTNTAGSTNSTITNQYADVPTTPFIPVPQLLGVMLLLFSLYMFFHYFIVIISTWR